MDVQEMLAKIRDMSNESIGIWFKKSVIDLCSGCISKDVDPIIRKAFNRAEKRMLIDQNNQSNQYQNRKSRQEAATRKDADLESFEKLDTSCTDFEDAANGNTAENRNHTEASIGNDEEKNNQRHDISTFCARTESATSSTPLQGAVHNTCTHPLSLGATAAPCNQVANGGYDQEKIRQQSASPAEAPLSASPDSGNGNVPDETAKSSFVAIVDDRSCKSGKSGDVAQAKRPYGEFRHVLLTDAEGAKLRDLYKEDLKLAIDILDSYIENGGKAAKKYKSHALVMRKGYWVWQKVQETKLTEKRLENASKSRKSFAEQEMDARTKFITTSVVPDDLTMEELEMFYG